MADSIGSYHLGATQARQAAPAGLQTSPPAQSVAPRRLLGNLVNKARSALTRWNARASRTGRSSAQPGSSCEEDPALPIDS
jgi:hypothetical protein